MKKPVKIIITVVVVVVTLGVIGNLIKTDVHVERSKPINASVEELQKQIADFREFDTWSPWKDIDPNATAEFKGPQGEVGAELHWSGNDEVGTGYQKVTSISSERIDIDLVFTAPWESKAKVYYTFVPKGEEVSVTWAYDGDMPVLMSLFMDMDEMIGSKYEKGLNTLDEKMNQ